MRVLGIDPGLRRAGFGVVDVDGTRLRYVASGTIVVPPALPLPERLKVILDNLRQVARDTRPDVAALEIVVLNANPASTLRSEEPTSELQSLMRISYAVFCLKKNILS